MADVTSIPSPVRNSARRSYSQLQAQRNIVWLLARGWDLILWIWSAVILGGMLVDVIVSKLVNGTPGLSRPDHWVTVQWMLTHRGVSAIGVALGIALTILFYAAHRRERAERLGLATSEYVVKRVKRLDPQDVGLERYVDAVYLPRHDQEAEVSADAEAREALRSAAIQAMYDPGSERECLGLYIIGRPMAGKRRLAWEAMLSELSGWTLVRWPRNPQHPFDLATLKGKPTILWLDGLSRYVGFNQAPVVSDLPRRFKDAGIPLVVIATCWEGEYQEKAEEAFGGMLSHLAAANLADITLEEGETLVRELARSQFRGDLEEFDNTPGSVLLGVAHMRSDVYPRLRRRHPRAAHILQTMKLLHSIGIEEFPASRVRAAAKAVFKLRAADWRDARDDLILSGFVRLSDSIDARGERALEPVAVAYLTRCVKDYPVPGAALSDDWPKLQQSFTEQQDATALIDLGDAYGRMTSGVDPQHKENLRPSKIRAIECLRLAIPMLDPAKDRMRLVNTQISLSWRLSALSELSPGHEAQSYLRDAYQALQAAKSNTDPESHPGAWGDAHLTLGSVLWEASKLAIGAERTELLAQAEVALSTAQEYTTRTRHTRRLAEIYGMLGVVFYEMSRESTGQTKVVLLEKALSSYSDALVYLEKDAEPGVWAKYQNNLGVALDSLAHESPPDARKDLLVQAASAYREAISVAEQAADPHSRGMWFQNLGNALTTLARLASGSARLEFSLEAAESFTSALDAIGNRAADPQMWATIHFSLGSLHVFAASEVEGQERERWLMRAEEDYQEALQVFLRGDFPIDWVRGEQGLASVSYNLATALTGQPVNCTRLKAAHKHIDNALSELSAENETADYEEAVKLHDLIQQALTKYGCDDFVFVTAQ